MELIDGGAVWEMFQPIVKVCSSRSSLHFTVFDHAMHLVKPRVFRFVDDIGVESWVYFSISVSFLWILSLKVSSAVESSTFSLCDLFCRRCSNHDFPSSQHALETWVIGEPSEFKLLVKKQNIICSNSSADESRIWKRADSFTRMLRTGELAGYIKDGQNSLPEETIGWIRTGTRWT